MNFSALSSSCETKLIIKVHLTVDWCRVQLKRNLCCFDRYKVASPRCSHLCVLLLTTPVGLDMPFADDDLISNNHHGDQQQQLLQSPATSPLHTSMTLGRHDTRHKRRPANLSRSTSIPAQKIYVTVDNKKHRFASLLLLAFYMRKIQPIDAA